MATRTDKAEKFVKIVVVDDWASVGYYLKARPSASGTWSHRDLDQAFRLKDGDRLEVQCPDGTVVRAKAVITKHTVSYSDHGHTYEAPSERLAIVPTKPLKLFGLDVNLTDFAKIKVRRA